MTMSNRKKKILRIIAIVGAILLLIATAVFFIVRELVQQLHVQDTNGDNTELVTLNDNDLTREETTYIATLSGQSTSGYQSGVKGNHVNLDYTTVNWHVKKFSGVRTIQATELEGQTAEITVTCNLKSGNLKIVLLDPDLKILYSYAVNGTETFTVELPTDGVYRIRVAGESAELEMKVQRKIIYT